MRAQCAGAGDVFLTNKNVVVDAYLFIIDFNYRFQFVWPTTWALCCPSRWHGAVSLRLFIDHIYPADIDTVREFPDGVNGNFIICCAQYLPSSWPFKNMLRLVCCVFHILERRSQRLSGDCCQACSPYGVPTSATMISNMLPCRELRQP
eukprot:scaffold345575_cov37-Prasinocladus_malaysianus.AAC.1